MVFERLLTFLHTLNVKKADVVFDGSKIFNSFHQEASSPLFVSTPVTHLTYLSGLQPIHSRMFLLLHPPDSFIHAKMASPFTHTHTHTLTRGGVTTDPGVFTSCSLLRAVYGRYIWIYLTVRRIHFISLNSADLGSAIIYDFILFFFLNQIRGRRYELTFTTLLFLLHLNYLGWAGGNRRKTTVESTSFLFD